MVRRTRPNKGGRIAVSCVQKTPGGTLLRRPWPLVILVWDRCCRLQEFRDSAGVPRIVRGGTVGGFGDTFVQVSPLAVWLARGALYSRFCLQPSQPQAAHCAIG